MFRQKILFVMPIVLPLVVWGDVRIQGPRALLAEADRLAMLYNWPKAVPLYTQAQLLAETSGDDRTALLARIGYVCATASAGSDPGIREEVTAWLKDASIQADPQLMLRVMVTKAFLDRNSNEGAAKESWKQILD